jgi:rare lipoprotein A
MKKEIAVLVLATLLLAACGTTSQRKAEGGGAPTSGGGYLAGDGPGAGPSVDIDAIPDAVPRNEPLHRYANRPYTALGKTYTPRTSAGNFKQRGMASWYGKKFHGQRTSSGEVYDMYAMSAAHPTLPLPSYARVTNLANGKSVIVRVNDRGPFLHERVIDLSYSAAYKLGYIGNGSAEVEVESIAPSANFNTINPNTVQSRPLETTAVVAAPLQVGSIPTLASGDTGVYLQLGAFESKDNAETFLEKMRGELSDTGKQLKLSRNGGLVRVHIGPYRSESEARNSAEALEDKLGFKPMVNLQ